MDTKSRNDLFNIEMKVSDIVDLNFQLLLVLPRIGLDLKYIAMPISEACEKCGIDPETFILICNVYTFNDYFPSSDTLENSSIENIIKYLHNSHSSYTGKALHELTLSLNKLIAPCNEKQKQIVLKFFTDYEKELKNHFAYEEENVFPYVQSLVQGKKCSGYSIEQFEEHHENIDEKLEDLKNIVMKYLPAECDSEMQIRVLMTIYYLQEDLKRHTYVENNILAPMVTRMEKNGK